MLGRTLLVALPAVFGTKMVPVDLSIRDAHLTISCVGPRLMLFSKFPFRETALSPICGTMERYNSLEVLKTDNFQKVFSFEWVFCDETIGRRPFHGFAFFCFFQDNEGNEKSSGLCGDGKEDSLKDEGVAAQAMKTRSKGGTEECCTNWQNVFLPIGRGELRVGAEDVLSVTVTCNVLDMQPSYTFFVRLKEKRSKKTTEETIEVQYSDLMPLICTVQQYRAREDATSKDATSNKCQKRKCAEKDKEGLVRHKKEDS